jgi:hypothetical protein
MKRSKGTAVLLAAMLMVGAFATAAFANSPKWNKISAATNNAGELDIKFKITGLGNQGQLMRFDASGDVTATVQCFNRGGKQPQGNPFAIGPVTVGDIDFIPTGRNGSISGTLTLAPDVGNVCSPHTARIVSASYTNVYVLASEADTNDFVLDYDWGTTVFNHPN